MPLHESESRIFSRRSLIAGSLQFGFFGLLGWRLQYLQIQNASEYATLAEENRVAVRLVGSPRGDILDRRGRVVATNEQDYQVVLVPEQARDTAATLQRLSVILNLSRRRVESILQRVERSPEFVPVTISNYLDWDRFSRVNLELPFLPGVVPQVGRRRVYAYGDVLAHLVGYVGAPTRDDIRGRRQFVESQVGRVGIERQYEDNLRGVAGVRRVEVNAYGRVIRELARQEGNAGNNIVLSIDVDLQRRVLERLGNKSAAVVVVDVMEGDVLALASAPSFDPNVLSSGIDEASWRSLNEDIRHPLLNKAIRGLYAPGSAFKMIVALAGLEAGVIDPSSTIECTGYFQIEREVFHCWKSDGHGILNMEAAIAQSCDTFFYDLAQRVGIRKIAEVARRFGFGARTDIELGGEHAGIVPDPDWKRAHHDGGWRLGETIIAGIGQGYLSTTPLQLVMMMARFADSLNNNGRIRAIRPRLVRAIGNRLQVPSQFPFLTADPTHLALIHRGLYRAVNRSEGTAYGSSLYVKGNFMCGKTGTIQVRRITPEEREAGITDNDDLPWELRDHALFVGYAPHDKPRYAIVVLIEHGGSGAQVAAPIARDILIPLLADASERKGAI